MLKTALQNLQLDHRTIVDQLTHVCMEAVRAGGRGSADDPLKLQRQLDAVRRKKEACLDSYFSGDITREEMHAAKSTYDAQIAELEHQVKTLPDSPVQIEETIRSAIIDLLSGKTENDAFYRPILDGITVHKDRHMELRLKELPHVFHFR